MIKKIAIVLVLLSTGLNAYSIISLEDFKLKMRQIQHRDPTEKEIDVAKKFIACIDRQEIKTAGVNDPKEVRRIVREIVEEKCANEIRDFVLVQRENKQPKK